MLSLAIAEISEHKMDYFKKKGYYFTNLLDY
jgi:hypothetical protein